MRESTDAEEVKAKEEELKAARKLVLMQELRQGLKRKGIVAGENVGDCVMEKPMNSWKMIGFK
jgi:hypothetical protein